MDFQYTHEQLMVRDTARDFAAGTIAPIAARIDETGEFPYETVKEMGKLGLLGLMTSEEYGGAGADTVSYVLAMQEIAKVCASHAVIMSVQNSLVCAGLEKFGTEEQKRNVLTPLADGHAIGAYSLTEPQSGSDAGNMRTLARRDGDNYIISGRKSWVTSGPVADWVLLFCSTDPGKGSRGTSCFIIDTTQAGFSRGKTEPKLGIRASATCELMFEDYCAPASMMLGKEGDGFKIAMTILDGGRIGIAAQALGIAQAAFEASVAYAKERFAFGHAIAEFQAVQFMLADMAMRIEAARLLTLSAAVKKDRHERFTKEASMAKVYSSETAMWVTTKAIQVHGGVGYSKDLPLERHFRDAKITEIYEGTSEIQRVVIARNVLA